MIYYYYSNRVLQDPALHRDSVSFAVEVTNLIRVVGAVVEAAEAVEVEEVAVQELGSIDMVRLLSNLMKTYRTKRSIQIVATVMAPFQVSVSKLSWFFFLFLVQIKQKQNADD